MEYDSLFIYVLLTDMENNAANLSVDENTTVIARSKEEACKLFVKLNPHYIKFWEEEEKEIGRTGNYESLSEDEKRKINEDILTDSGGIFKIPLKSVPGIENLSEFIKKEAERNSK